MSNSSDSEARLLAVATLSPRSGNRFDCAFDDATRAEIAQELGISALRKLSFKGEIRPAPDNRWKLTAMLGATVVQPCVVSLEPVTTRIDETVVRLFVPNMDPAMEPDAGLDSDAEDGVEMPADDTLEPLGDRIDLQAIMTEALALYLPDYPRKTGAELGESIFSAPGVTPMSDADAHPFAGLAKLKDQSPDES